jgi:hypothetical protein
MHPIYSLFTTDTNELSFITRDEPKGDHHLEQFVCFYLFYPLLRERVQRTVV